MSSGKEDSIIKTKKTKNKNSPDDKISDKHKNKSDGTKKRVKIKHKKSDNEYYNKNRENVIDAGNFNIVQSLREGKRENVHRSLPQWLKTPNVVSSNIKEHKVPCSDLEHLLDEDMMQTLKENKIDSFFPVQHQLIKELLQNAGQMTCQFPIGGVPISDICCSAPTGSGKTLAFVIPIIQILKVCTFRALRCLVVVPVVELASQVYRVFKAFASNTNLKIGLANGLKPFSTEQSNLIDLKSPYGPTSKVDILVSTPGRLVDHILMSDHFNLSQLRFLVIDEADRMMEEVKQDWLIHVERCVLRSTTTANSIAPNCNDTNNSRDKYKFTLQRTQSASSLSSWLSLNQTFLLSSSSLSSPSSLSLPPFCEIPDDYTSSDTMATTTVSCIQKPRMQLQKLLFSATLSHNPEKLQLLNLYQPKLFTSVVTNVSQKMIKTKRKRDGDDDDHDDGGGYVKVINNDIDDNDHDRSLNGNNNDGNDNDDVGDDNDDDEKKLAKKKKKIKLDDDENDGTKINKVDEKNVKNEFLGKYVTPVGLKENFIEAEKSQKPLLVFHTLKTMSFNSVLCFTNSVLSASRLCSLMKLMGVKACEFSSNLHISKRDRVVKQFNAKKLNLMCCSDAMSRGLDIDDVDCVISYDTPSSLKTYIHRIGRTARAGKEGTAIALLEKKEIRYFKELLKEAGKDKKVKEITVNRSRLKPYLQQYQKCLTSLSRMVQPSTRVQKQKFRGNKTVKKN